MNEPGPVSAAGATTAGAATAGAAAALASAARGLSPAARLCRLAELEAAISRLQAEQLTILAAIGTDPVTTTVAGSMAGAADKNWAVEDIAVTLRLSPGSARARLGEACEAVRLPCVLNLLVAGAISAGHV